ncbi:hypothetical protein NQ318_018471 [Aromia moschata]|uniref:27 kDa hemolymph protein n=1 Tax=Aromia moschata TaxID=1265417 RepID=A0AAV8YKJ1_9CUCU|nr:hypothetical protein NQ318_018471 [Aromia moschata]
MNMPRRFFLIAAIVGYVASQTINEIDVDDVKKKLEAEIPGIDEFEEKLNKTKLPSAEDVQEVLKEKCKKNGAEDAIENLQEQQVYTKECVESYLNYDEIQNELNEAKKTGSMDEVFGKYCKKWPSIYACFDNVTTSAKRCMDNRELKAFNKSMEILDELQSFMCFKDGDRLAMFVAEGGVECIKEQKDGVLECLNSTLGSRIPDPDDLSVGSLPTFLFTEKDCEDFDVVRECVNKQLEKCKDSTPANIVDAFFKFLKKHMPCQSSPARIAENLTGGSWTVTSSILFVIAATSLSKLL